MRTLLVLVAAVLVLAGCGARTADNDPQPVGAGDNAGDAAGDTAGDSQPPLAGRTFVMESATQQGEPFAVVSGTTVELRFTDDGKLVATAGCNTMSGAATVRDDRLLADLAATEKACDEPRHAQDQWLSALLTSGPEVGVDGDRLTLTTPEAELVLSEQQDVPLHDTTWTVTTLVEGQSASAAPVEATLTFGDGTVEVTGLCNLKAVTYEESGPALTFQLGVLTRMACAPEIMTVENAAVRVLDGEATHEVDGTTLTITNGDHSLQLTAS